jgi:flagella basal body P-ring formation protein FlgA
VLAGEDRTLASLALQRTAGQAEENRLHSVIHAGDRLVIEEHTAHMDAILDARALSPAAVGALFAARLTAGGRVVRVMALGPGRAALQAESGVWP